MTFDESIITTAEPKITIKTNHLWVRAGSLVAGAADEPFPGEIDIILLGVQSNEHMVIDDTITPANKVLCVTGRMELYGKFPGTVHTRLVS